MLIIGARPSDRPRRAHRLFWRVVRDHGTRSRASAAGAPPQRTTHVIDPVDGPLAEQVRDSWETTGRELPSWTTGVPALIGEALQSVRKGVAGA